VRFLLRFTGLALGTIRPKVFHAERLQDSPYGLVVLLEERHHGSKVRPEQRRQPPSPHLNGVQYPLDGLISFRSRFAIEAS
jgi:hypothetical protein